MNQTFNLKRFSLLFVKHTVDNYKTYLMAFLVLIGMLILTMGFAAYVEGGRLPKQAQIPFFIFFFIIAGSIFTSIIFSDLGNKKKAISILTLPASHFEKYLIGWIYSYVIFQLLFVPAFYLIVMLIHQLSTIKSDTDIQLLNLFSNEDHLYFVFFIYAVLHAMVLRGSIFFEKLHFIKTAFVFFIGVFTIAYLNIKFIQAFISKTVISAIPFQAVILKDDNNSFHSFGMPNKYDTYTVVMILIVVCILWACSFYRLKEKEV